MLIGAVSVFYAFNVWSRGGWHFGVNTIADQRLYAMGTIAVLVGIMAGQLGNLLSTRTGLYSVLSSNPLRNKWILIGIAGEFTILFLILYVPFLQAIFNTTGLTPFDWLALNALAPAVIVLEEVRKYFKRQNVKIMG